MALVQQNLFMRLHKWATRQSENFLTEALALVLQHLLKQEPEAGVAFLNNFGPDFLKLKPEDARLVEIRTQVGLSEGTPDLEISTPRQRVLIEVKAESPVNPEQLKRYRRLLGETGAASTALFLLTHYPVELQTLPERPDAWIRWYQVADWMEQQCSRYAMNKVSAYLVGEFLGFLQGRNMVMEQVTYEMAGGVRALRAFIEMLYEAANLCGLPAKYSSSRSYMGIYLDKKRFWVGIYYDRPELLKFATQPAFPVDSEAAARLGVGTVLKWDDSSPAWERDIDLSDESVHFFARSKVRQIEFLEQFLSESIALAAQIRSQATPPSETSPEATDSDERAPLPE